MNALFWNYKAFFLSLSFKCCWNCFSKHETSSIETSLICCSSAPIFLNLINPSAPVQMSMQSPFLRFPHFHSKEFRSWRESTYFAHVLIIAIAFIGLGSTLLKLVHLRWNIFTKALAWHSCVFVECELCSCVTGWVLGSCMSLGISWIEYGNSKIPSIKLLFLPTMLIVDGMVAIEMDYLRQD